MQEIAVSLRYKIPLHELRKWPEQDYIDILIGLQLQAEAESEAQ